MRRICSVICVAVGGVGLSVSGPAPSAHAADPSPIIYAVNPFGNEVGYPGLTPFQLSTGAVTSAKLLTIPAGPFAGEPVAGANAIALDPTTNTAYTAFKFGEEFDQGVPRHLATINLSNGQLTTIGSLSRQIAGLAFRTDGTLYAVSGDGDTNCGACLYTVNKATGALTLQKDLGTGDTDGEAIAYNPNDDMIYHASGFTPATFETIDPDNSFAQTNIGFTGTGDGPDQVTGIGFDGTNFVMSDTGSDVWSVTPAGGFTHVSDSDTDFFFRGLVIGPPVTVLDFGDAPDGVGTPPQDAYPTLSASTGASHVPVGPILGFDYPDAEVDALPSIDADGDDVDGVEDEDGVVFHNDLLAGLVTNVRVGSANGGTLDGWIDYNRDGDWDDAGEQVFNSIVLAAGFTELSILIPAGITTGTSYARFRISTAGGLEPTGEAPNGEVEDYKVLLKQRAPGQKYRCGQEVKGLVKLNTDLFDCPEHGLVVKKAETTIILNGHTIDGVGNGSGIDNNRHNKRNVVVKGRGGTIKEFASGVSGGGGCAPETVVRGVTIEGVIGSGIFVCGVRSLVENNDIDGGRFGIVFQGNRITVRGNTVANVSREGIRQNCCGNKNGKIIENTVSNSGEDGIEVNSEIVKVRDNEITSSVENGLIVNGGVDVATITGSGNDTNGDPCLPARLCAV